MLIQCPQQKCGAVFEHPVELGTGGHQDDTCGGCGLVLQWDIPLRPGPGGAAIDMGPFRPCRHAERRKRIALVPLEVEE